MKNQAQLVVIGSGIAGTATCYHLAKMGWSDIVVLDQGPLYRTGGSTSHAPGGMFQTNASKWMTECANYTVNLFAELEVNGVKGGVKAGGIELAENPTRMEDLKRKAGFAKSWGLSPELLSPTECKSLVPILDEKQIYGGLYVPNDMIGNAIVASEAMANSAKENGVTFYGEVIVERILTQNKQVTEVVTNQGNIKTNQVLVCAGIWGPRIADMVGEHFPMQPMQHQYLKTEEIDELKVISNNGETEINMPLLRLQDSGAYYRQHGSCFGLGNYFHTALAVDAYDILPNEKSKLMASIKEFTPEHFGRTHAATERVFPCVKGKKFTYEINGMFSFTADGMPLMGESMKVKGFWVCEGVWITHSAGIGKAMAEWLDTGRPQDDVHEGDFNRFYSHHKTKIFALTRGKQQYREVYDIVHPQQQIEYPRGLRKSTFYERQRELGAEFFEVAGWERPQWYDVNRILVESSYPNYYHQRRGWETCYWSTTEIGEHFHTRQHAAIYDLTAFAKFEVIGNDAFNFLQRLCVNNVDVEEHKIVYTSLVNQYGAIEADLTVTRLEKNRFWVLTGGANGPHDFAWIKQNIRPDENVFISDLGSKYCSLGLWGPKARTILQEVVNEDISNAGFSFYSYKRLTIGYIPVEALRISFVGELGWEIYCPTEYGLSLWDTLWQAGQPHQLIAAGAGAFDSLRVEKGYLNWGSDLKPINDPYQAGLGWTVKLDKHDFIGREALAEIKQRPKAKKLCTLVLDDTNVILGNEPVLHNNRVVGYITSSNTGYFVGKQIAFSYLPAELSALGTELEVEYFAKRYSAEVVQSPVYDTENKKLKS